MQLAKEAEKVRLEAVLERCCGLDVHKKTVTACLLIGSLEEDALSHLKCNRRGIG